MRETATKACLELSPDVDLEEMFDILTAAHNDTFLSADFVPDKASKSAKGNLCFYF